MIHLQETIRSLIPIALTFVIVLGYHASISSVLSGIQAFTVTITLSIVTWYVICRVAFDSEGYLSINNQTP